MLALDTSACIPLARTEAHGPTELPRRLRNMIFIWRWPCLSSYKFYSFGKRSDWILGHEQQFPNHYHVSIAHYLVQSRDSFRYLFNQLLLNKCLLNSIEEDGRWRADLCEFCFRNSRGTSWDPQSPERTVIFLPVSSHPHVRRSSPEAHSLQMHSGVGDISLNCTLSSLSIKSLRSLWF